MPIPMPVVFYTGSAILEKFTIDDSGSRLLVLIQTSKPVECFVFERHNPPSLFVQFTSSGVFASGAPVQVVGEDPLAEIRYGYSSFKDATMAGGDSAHPSQLDYLELKLNRSVFYHVQQEGWVTVVGLDRSTTKVDVPDLDFRFEAAKYEGAANLPDNPMTEDFVQIAQDNSRLLTVAREEVELAKARVGEASRAMFPALSAKASQTRGREVNPFPQDNFDGFEAATYKRNEYGLQATHPIYESGRLYGALRQAKLNRQMAIENLRKQAQDLTFEVKKAYFTLLKNQSILRARRELVAQGEVIKNMVKQKQKLDLTSRAEVLNVSAQADQSKYQLTGDEQDVALSRLVLISLLNQSKPVPDPLPGELSFARLSFNVESIINWAAEHRPDMRIARLNTELAKYGWKAANADNNLKLDASGFYGKAGAAYTGNDLIMDTAWNVGLRASRSFWGNTVKASFSKEKTAPDLGQSYVTDSQQKAVEVGFLDSMAGQSNARQAELQYERSKAELVEASRKAEYEVRETYYNLEKAARQLEAVRQDLVFRHKDLEITREKVKLGLAELSQLMAAEVADDQAKTTEQDALAAYNIALAAMDRVAGAEVVRK
jgi:outer membrane protein